MNKSYYKFGENYAENEINKKIKNATIRKRKLLPLTSEDRLENLPSIYAKVPADPTKKNKSAKNFFINIIKQIPPESYKKFKIDYDQSNNIDISKVKYESDDEFNFWYKKINKFKICLEILKKTQEVYFILSEM